MGPSFEEKSVWEQLIATVLGLGAYFIIAGKMMAAGVTALPAYVPLFIAAVVLIVALVIVGHILAAITGRTEKRDERDRLIEWRAESNSAWILGAGIFTAVMAMTASIEAVWVAHLLMVSLFASEVVALVLRLSYYRWGMGR